MGKKQWQLAVSLASWLVVAGLLRAELLVVQGSDTLGSRAMPRLIDAFTRQNPWVFFEFSAEGTTTGITGLIAGEVDLAMASRSPLPSELVAAQRRGVRLEPITVAFDGIALVVNELNPVMNLSLREIEWIFTGEVRDWAGVRGVPGPLSPYARNTASGTFTSFQELALRGRDYGARTMLLAGHEQITREVAANPQGIGYVGLGFLDTPGVHVLAIDGSPPTLAEILSGDYPLARPLFLMVNQAEVRPAVARFMRFVLSREGQQIMAASDFVPVRREAGSPPVAESEGHAGE